MRNSYFEGRGKHVEDLILCDKAVADAIVQNETLPPKLALFNSMRAVYSGHHLGTTLSLPDFDTKEDMCKCANRLRAPSRVRAYLEKEKPTKREAEGAMDDVILFTMSKKRKI